MAPWWAPLWALPLRVVVASAQLACQAILSAYHGREEPKYRHVVQRACGRRNRRTAFLLGLGQAAGRARHMGFTSLVSRFLAGRRWRKQQTHRRGRKPLPPAALVALFYIHIAQLLTTIGAARIPFLEQLGIWWACCHFLVCLGYFPTLTGTSLADGDLDASTSSEEIDMEGLSGVYCTEYWMDEDEDGDICICST